MARNPFRGRLTNAPCRAAKRQRAKNSWWMHLGATEIGTRQKIQQCWAGHTLATTNSLFLAGYALGLRLGAAREGRGWRRRATTARGVWLQCIFVERQVGRSPFGTKKRSTEITSMIPTQKSKDASRMQNPVFVSYLRPSEGQNLKGRK